VRSVRLSAPRGNCAPRCCALGSRGLRVTDLISRAGPHRLERSFDRHLLGRGKLRPSFYKRGDMLSRLAPYNGTSNVPGPELSASALSSLNHHSCFMGRSAGANALHCRGAESPAQVTELVKSAHCASASGTQRVQPSPPRSPLGEAAPLRRRRFRGSLPRRGGRGSRSSRSMAEVGWRVRGVGGGADQNRLHPVSLPCRGGRRCTKENIEAKLRCSEGN
jgi:hypothetical protein